MFIPVFKKPLPTEETEVDGSIADMLISDRPLDINDPDPLGFKPIALGLSRFIRNVNTQPPLTIAISGQWGSGKSSLMNMLKADLRQNKFQSVWFNAWHHQKEEHLLATLLENIRTHAVPPIWHPKNLVFRYRLLKLRLKRSWPILFLLLAAYSALAGFLWAHPTALGLLSTNLEHILIDLQNGEWPHFDESGTFFGVLVIALGPLSLLAKALRAFGTKPARLMASMSGRFRVRDFTAQAGFRYRFEREFKDVTRALSPHSLVILIDDLDRCKPENVLEVLEAVNFLVSAGDCFVVLGLDLDRVERCVGLGFKDVAEELLDDTDIPELQNNNDSQTIGDAGKRRRGQFARQYLEKLINIEVPVPEPSEAQARNLLVPSANGGIQTESIWRSVGRELTQRTRALVPAIMLTATIIFGFWGGRSLLFEPVQEAQLNQQQSTDETEVTIGQPGILLEPKPEPERDTKISKFESGQTARFPRTLFVAPLLLLLGLGVWRLSILPESIVRDSPEFLQALGVWSPLVYAKQPTPRSVKRFMNRLRYFAMRLPEEESRKSIGMRLKGFLERIRGKNLPETVAVKKELTEATLVALSALHNFNHEWLENEQDWSKIKKGEVVKASNGSPEDLGQMQLLQITLQNAIKNHKSKFKQWPPTDKDIEKLLNLSKGIRVS
ncbi:MAG: hypothetical protein E2O76_07420 [Caldithrix sp.]|nr:MAG: hypothetical protein E2O76_07420 [Caldithrix sp.]